MRAPHARRGRGVHRRIAGIGDEVDVGVRQLAAHEADLGGVGSQPEVRRQRLVQRGAHRRVIGHHLHVRAGRKQGCRFCCDLRRDPRGIEVARRHRRRAAHGDDLAARLYVGSQLVQHLGRQPAHARHHQHRVLQAEREDGFGIDVVQVVAGVQDLFGELGRHMVLHPVGQRHLARHGTGVHVVVRQEHRDLIGGLPLAHQPAHAGQVAIHVRHHVPPGVVVVEHGGGVEGITGCAGPGRGVGPAVADEQVHAFEQHAVGLGLHVERRGRESGRIQPGPGLGRDHRAPVQVAGGRREAGEGEGAVLRPLAFRQCDQAVARHRDSRIAIRLRAEQGLASPGPVIHRGEVALVHQFRLGQRPVALERARLLALAMKDRRQVRQNVVAAALPEFLGEVGGPVAAVDLEAVREHRVGRLLAEGLQQRFGHGLEVVLDRLAVQVVEHEAFGIQRRTLDLLAGAGGDIGQHHALPGAWCDGGAAAGVRTGPDALQLAGLVLLGIAGGDEGRQQALAVHHRRQREAPAPGRHLDAGQAQARGGVLDLDVRPAEGPARTERDVHAQPLRAALAVGEGDGVQELRRQVGQVPDAARRIVELHRVDRLDLEAAEAAGLHGRDLAFQLGRHHGGAEPPPAHQRPGVRRRGCHARGDLGDAVEHHRILGGRRAGQRGHQNADGAGKEGGLVYQGLAHE